MGCDGGTIPRRDELVRVKKKPEAKDKDSELAFQWKYCSITQQLLREPIVTCGHGQLYNKEAVIEMLLNKETLPEFASHIKGLSSIKELKLTENPSYNKDESKDSGTNVQTSPYICPVIGLEMSGKFKFVALWTCGCVFSERALKQINSKVCHKCQTPFTNDDVVILNAADEDLDLMRTRLETRLAKNKKPKKSKVKKEPTETIQNNESAAETSSKIEVKLDLKIEKGKHIIKGGGPTGSKLKRSGKLQEEEIDVKKMKAEYSVAKDEGASDVYKSLFTTHSSEKEQERAHWVTYNPFYN